jgi:protoheme IX farnesyltransferase
MKGGYQRARVPMLPVIRGEAETREQILLYSVLLVALSVVVFALGLLGLVYLVSALALGGLLVYYSVRLRAEATASAARRMFKFSMLYLALLFAAMAVDRVI